MADLATIWLAAGVPQSDNTGRWDDQGGVWWDDQTPLFFTPNPTPLDGIGGIGAAMGQLTFRTRPQTDYTLRYIPPAGSRISYFKAADNSTLTSLGLTATTDPDGLGATLLVPAAAAAVAAPKAITPVLATIGTPTVTAKQLLTSAAGGANELGGWTAVVGASGGLSAVNALSNLWELKQGASEQSRVYFNGGAGGTDGIVQVAGAAATAGGLRLILRHPNTGTGQCVGVQFVPDGEKTVVTIFNSADGHAVTTPFGTPGNHFARIGDAFVYEAWLIGTAVVARVNGDVVTTATVTTTATGTSFGVSSNSTTIARFNRIAIAGFAAANTGSPNVSGTPAINGTVTLSVTPAATERLVEPSWGGRVSATSVITSEPLGEGANIVGYTLQTQRDVVVEDAAGTWA